MTAHVPGGPLGAALVTVLLAGVGLAAVVFPGRSRRSRRRAALTAAGLFTLALAVSGPVESLADRTFSAHMLQHLAIVVVAPGLLSGGRAVATLAAVLHRIGVAPARRGPGARRWRAATLGREGQLLGAAAGYHAIVLTFWHLPAVFEAAVARPFVHAVEHASMFTAGAALFTAWAAFARRAPVAAFAATFTTAVHGAAVGALITFNPRPVFAVADGTTTLTDQQVAGLLMWVPTGLVYVALALVVVWRAADPRAADPGAVRLLEDSVVRGSTPSN